MKLNEALKLPVGSPITNLTTTVKRAFDARTVNTQYGERSVLNAIVADGSDECRLSWWDPTVPATELAGRRVKIDARQTKKGALGGAMLKQGRDKDNRPRLEISVSGDHMVLAGESAVPAPVVSDSPSSPTTSSDDGNGRLRESELYDLINRAGGRVTEMLMANGAQPEAQAICAVVDTLLIAATNGRFVLDVNDAPVAERRSRGNEDDEIDDIPF